MSIKIGGVDIEKILVGNGGGGASPAIKIMMGTGTSAVQVWPNPRVVTITAGSNGQITPSSETGDIDLIDNFTTGIGRGVTFIAPVSCNRDLYRILPSGAILAGETVPVGVRVRELTSGTAGTYIFTEVL